VRLPGRHHKFEIIVKIARSLDYLAVGEQWQLIYDLVTVFTAVKILDGFVYGINNFRILRVRCLTPIGGSTSKGVSLLVVIFVLKTDYSVREL